MSPSRASPDQAVSAEVGDVRPYLLHQPKPGTSDMHDGARNGKSQRSARAFQSGKRLGMEAADQALERDDKKWVPVFVLKSRENKDSRAICDSFLSQIALEHRQPFLTNGRGG